MFSFISKNDILNPVATILSQKSMVRSNCINIAKKIGSLNVLEACLVEKYNDT